MHNNKIVRFRRVGDIFDSTLLPDLPVFKLNSEYLFCRISCSEGLCKIHIQTDSLLGLIHFPVQYVIQIWGEVQLIMLPELQDVSLCPRLAIAWNLLSFEPVRLPSSD